VNTVADGLTAAPRAAASIAAAINAEEKTDLQH
jgi:hypothetical protein